MNFICFFLFVFYVATRRCNITYVAQLICLMGSVGSGVLKLLSHVFDQLILLMQLELIHSFIHSLILHKRSIPRALGARRERGGRYINRQLESRGAQAQCLILT